MRQILVYAVLYCTSSKQIILVSGKIQRKKAAIRNFDIFGFEFFRKFQMKPSKKGDNFYNNENYRYFFSRVRFLKEQFEFFDSISFF